ncbi:hypothetical protein ACTRF2_001142 [Listeria monocytogenes]
MMAVVLILFVFGILQNVAIYAYQKGREKADVNTDLDSDNMDALIDWSNVRNINH